MLSRDQLLGFVIGMVEVNDADLLDHDHILAPEICIPGDRPAIRALRDIVEPLCRDYDYTVSIDFDSRVDGKSAAFAQMLRKQCNNPVKRKALRREFREALSAIDDSKVFDLLPRDSHDQIQQIRTILRAISNPERAQQDGDLKPNPAAS